jgi:hypothetical protein
MHNYWIKALIACGLGLSVAWTALIGYGLTILIELGF